MLALHAVGRVGGGEGAAYLKLGVNFSLWEAHVFTKLVICQGDVCSIWWTIITILIFISLILILILFFLSIQDFEVVDNEENAEWEKEIEDMLEEEDNK